MSLARTVTGSAQCAEHGDYDYVATRVGAHLVGARCPKCLGRSFEDAEQASQPRLERERQALLERRKREAGIPPAFWHAEFASFTPLEPRQQAVMRIMRSYANGFARILSTRPAPGIVMAGPPGSGKTHLACALANDLIARGHGVQYVQVAMLMMRLRDASQNRLEMGVSGLIHRLSQSEFLVMDDYGAHQASDLYYEWLLALVDARYQRNVPTLITTNLSLVQLHAELDARVIERILGSGGAEIVCDWPSLRGQVPR